MPHDANSGKYPKCFITVPYTALDLPAPRYVEKIDYTADRSGVTGFAAGKRIILSMEVLIIETAMYIMLSISTEKIISSPKLSKIDSVIHTENLSVKRCFHYCGKAYTKPDIQTDRQTLSPVSAKYSTAPALRASSAVDIGTTASKFSSI